MFGMPLEQFLFMAEASGADNLVSTRLAKLNAVINEIRNDPNCWKTLSEIKEIATHHDLPELTEKDIEYITNRI